MTPPIDAGHEQGTQAVSEIRPQATATVTRMVRPAAQPIPLHPMGGTPKVTHHAIWDKNNYGFWLAVCLVISLVFSVIYRAVV